MDLRIKICCISSADEARMAVEAGADAIGLVGPMPSGPGIISLELAGKIVEMVSGKIETFFLTSETSVAAIVGQYEEVLPTSLQIVDSIDNGDHRLLRSALPDVNLVQVIHVLSEQSVEESAIASETADTILLDSGNPNLEIKELGGTGKTHDWRFSAEIVKRVTKPVFLAGGLDPQNVADAIRTVRPFGIDVCSGVRSNGMLDPIKLEKFMHSVKNAVG